MKNKFYKFIILSFLISSLSSQNTFSQIIMEMNSGITTQLNSASNCRIPQYQTYFCGWACGINGTVIRSTYTSSQWRNVSGNGIPSNIVLDNICGLDSNVAFVAGHLNSNTWVWKTTNGGNNWIQVFTQPNGKINAVWMKNFLQGFIDGNPVGGRWSLWKTTNGGFNWDSTGLYLHQDSSETGWANSLCMPMSYYTNPDDTNKIWFGTNNYRIYYSSNYGQSWSFQSTSPEQNSYCITFGAMYSDQMLYAGGSNYLLKSTNYGLNWTTVSIGGSGNITGVTLCWYGWYLTRENKIYLHQSNPENWYAFFTAPAGNYTYVDNRGFGVWVDHYAVRNNGGITFLCEGEGVKKIGTDVPQYYSLSQNYPNPFNPSTKFKIQIAKLLDVKVMIFDVLGREVATLVNEQLKPGTYEVTWDGSSYASGIYFYKLMTADYSETKKMILIK